MSNPPANPAKDGIVLEAPLSDYLNDQVAAIVLEIVNEQVKRLEEELLKVREGQFVGLSRLLEEA